MSEPTIRMAELGDVEELVELRSDFTFEGVARQVPRDRYEEE